MTYRDLTGMRFGLLTVKSHIEARNGKHTWLVHCLCGVEKTMRSDTLLSGRVKSCGCSSNQFRKNKMAKRYNLINCHFGRLFVLSRAESIRSGGSPYSAWECKCDCGSIVTVRGAHLRNGKTKSCGCLQLERVSKVPGASGFNHLLASYRAAAEQRGIEWRLSEDEFRTLVTGNCYYCGVVPKQISGQSTVGRFIYNGVDRLNNSGGYVPGNVVSCCGTHNQMKGTMSYEQFVANCEVVVRHRDRLPLKATA
jgi:hypothetical protein